jgi:hypothetical protein
MSNPKNGIQSMIKLINAKANVVTKTPGPPAKFPPPPVGGPYRALCEPFWQGAELAVGSVCFLNMVLRLDGTMAPQYEIIVRFPIESADDAHEVRLMLARQLPSYDLPEGEAEQRMRITIRDEPSSSSGVAVSAIDWAPEPGATPAQHAALKAVLNSGVTPAVVHAEPVNVASVVPVVRTAAELEAEGYPAHEIRKRHPNWNRVH